MKIKLILPLLFILIFITGVNAIVSPFLTTSDASIILGEKFTFEAGYVASHIPVSVTINLLDSSKSFIKNIKSADINNKFYAEQFNLTENDYKKSGVYYINFIAEMYNPVLGIVETDTAELSFTVTQPIDQPAVWQTLTNKEVNEDSPAGTIVYQGLKTLCNDPDNDEIVTVTSQHSYYSLYFDNNDLKIRNLELNYNGIETVGLSCNNVAASFSLNVKAVNDAPNVLDIPDQTIQEGASFTSISLDSYVTDVDNSDSEITWTYSGNSKLTVSIVNRIATITISDINWNGQETIKFKATDKNGLSDEDSAIFKVNTVNDGPIINSFSPLTAQDMEIGQQQTFTVNASDIDNAVLNYRWYVNDALQGETTNKFTYTASSAGNKVIRAAVYDNEIYALNPPEWAFNVNEIPNQLPNAIIDSPASDKTITAGDSINLRGHGEDTDGTIIAYSWNFGDGRTSNLQNPGNVQFNTAGTYIVIFNVQDNDNEWDKTPATVTITVEEKIYLNPVAYFDVNPASGTTETVFEFDASQSHDENEFHPFWQECMRANLNNDLKVDIFDLTTLLGILSRNEENGDVNNDGKTNIFDLLELLKMLRESACSESLSALKYKWSFGDGVETTEYSFEDKIKHTYIEPGTYEAELTAINSYGLTDTFSRNITVTEAPNKLPNAVIDSPATDQTITVGQSVNFQGHGEDIDGTIIAYSWNFGDGRTSNIQNPGNVQFNTAGIYTVIFNVQDNDNEWDLTPASVIITVNLAQVNNAPIVSIISPAAPIVNISVNDLVYFQGSAQDPDNDNIIAYEWSFGDGRTSNVLIPGNVQFNTAGTYTVTFRAQDEHGLWSGYAMKTILVSTAVPELRKVILPRERIHINQIDFFNDINNIKPGEELLAYVEFTNNDNLDMKKTKLTISIPELGVYKRIGPFNLEKGDKTSRIVSLEIPDYAQAKEYDVRIAISENGELQRVKNRFIKVI